MSKNPMPMTYEDLKFLKPLVEYYNLCPEQLPIRVLNALDSLKMLLEEQS